MVFALWIKVTPLGEPPRGLYPVVGAREGMRGGGGEYVHYREHCDANLAVAYYMHLAKRDAILGKRIH